jgi:uncharacterized protein (DUF1501 family)
MSEYVHDDLVDALQADPERPLSMMQRRRFLQGAIAAGGTAAVLPTALIEQAAAQASTDTIVVTVSLAGGNDGLNTLGPFGNARYRQLRGPLAVDQAAAHPVGDSLSFHPNLRRLATRYRRGEVAIVRGVGDPGLDHSHFSNLARWQAGNPDGRIGGTGWLGRWLDLAQTSQFSGVAIGGQGVPLHMRGIDTDVTDLPRGGGALYGSDRSEQRDQRMYRAIRQMGKEDDRAPWINKVGAVNALAIDAAQAVAGAYRNELPDGRLLRDLVLAARVINLNLGTRVLNVWQGGYDTHDNQIGSNSGVGDHADLLAELDASLDTFFNSLTPAMASRVIVVVYSEFGRRAESNGSRGTDHGTSSHMFLAGRRIKGGLYGNAPPLNALDDRGDFRVTTDFRDVYATVVEQALGASSDAVLGRSYQALDLIGDASPAVSSLSQRASEIRDRREQNSDDYLLLHTPTF